MTSESDFTAALLDPSAAVPDGVRSYRGGSDPLRFAVYRNNVHVSLVGVLAAKFPVCAQLVGEDFFTAMARIYVADTKPATPVMMHYGESFPTFISGFAGARSLPYLADVARLEALWAVAHNAADEQPLTPAMLAGFDMLALLAQSLRLHPATGLLASPHAVGLIWSAHQGGEKAPIPAGPQHVLVTRPAADVQVTIVSASDHAFLGQLAPGRPLGEAAAQVIARDPDFDLGTALVGLIGLGCFAAPQLED